MERHSGCGIPPRTRSAVGKVYVIAKQLLSIHNVRTNMFQISAPPSPRFEAAYVRFRLYKRLCLEWATRANAPLVYSFHSFTLILDRCLVFGFVCPESSNSNPTSVIHVAHGCACIILTVLSWTPLVSTPLAPNKSVKHVANRRRNFSK